jgi:class 3 adenylate cyclase
VEAINRFPDQNPNPVLRIDADGSLRYANPASAPVTEAWGASVGERVAEPWLGQVRAAAAEGRPFDVRCERRTFAIHAVEVSDLGFVNIYGTEVTAARLIERFPDRNPSPVLRLDADRVVRYANAASAELLEYLGIALGDRLPGELGEQIGEVLRGVDPGPVETRTNGRTFALTPVAVPELDVVNVYATDVTAHRAITKFPDANPNPVFRFGPDGVLLYANAASTALIDGLGCQIGRQLSRELLEPLLACVASEGGAPLEIESAGRVYALLAIDVPAFGFVNVYGTDVTAVKQLEILHRENERLLLNILPEPIAQRLRDGERLIADRFDDVTLLFADIVEFTRISSQMAADELVMVLDAVFTVFDQLVERYALEKVKTIGDAYMVVGGMPERSTDHTERLAEMALDLAQGVARIEAAARLGIRFRIGMHCGPVVAGVVGRKKFIYDVWGDTVNVASRMESLGVPGRIQVTGAVEERLRDRFELEARGIVEVKGKGPMPTWFLSGRRDRAASSAGAGASDAEPGAAARA